MIGTLQTQPALARPELIAPPVIEALWAWPARSAEVFVAPIDPALADTAAFCEAYSVRPEDAANCVVVVGKRGGDLKYAACVVLATTRVDVNGAVRRLLDVRKASFAPMEDAVAETAMEYGGITPIGLPKGWPLLIDARVAASGLVIVGSGLRGSKIAVPGAALADLPNAEVVNDLAR